MSRLPLPAALTRDIPRRPERRGDGNIGLYLDKFVPRDERDWSFKGEQRRSELAAYAGQWTRPLAAAALERRVDGMCEMTDSRPEGAAGRWYEAPDDGFLLCRLEVELDGRLLVDYGRTTAIESSLSFHPILGVPRIPGSALKGITGAWSEEARGQRDPALGEGPGPEHGGRRGTVDFLDALPANGVFSLTLDVLTPHYSAYYQGKSAPDRQGITAPGDWLSPKPFTFLTVTGARFVFDLVSSVKDDLARVGTLLAEAIVERGVGAKTAAGYGYFVES